MRRLLLPILIAFAVQGFAQEKGAVDTTVVKDSIYNFPDSMPQYPGGMSEMLIYIMNNIKYPNTDEDIQGSVYISFIVETDGSITDVKIIKGIPGGSGLEKEAVRVVRTFPKWKPGMQNGKPVRVKYNIPIKFRH